MKKILFIILGNLILLSNSKLCKDNNTQLAYNYGDKINGHEQKLCFLCRCELDGSFSCFDHGCALINCRLPKFGEAECCKILKCKSFKMGGSVFLGILGIAGACLCCNGVCDDNQNDGCCGECCECCACCDCDCNCRCCRMCDCCCKQMCC